MCSPVSVSRFLKEPELGFQNYWSGTGAKNEFLFKLIKYCSIGMASDIYHLMNGKRNNEEAPRKQSTQECLAGLSMVLNVSVNPNSEVNPDSDVHPNSKPKSDVSLFLPVSLKDLTIKIEDLNELTVENAIAILFQSGYLSIRSFKDGTALLGFTNYHVIHTITELIRKYGLSISDSAGLKDN